MRAPSSAARPWPDAWEEALYGRDGFYLRPEGPRGHFRTAAHASSSGLLGRALAALAQRCGCTCVVDVGAGRGELLESIGRADPALRLVAVERADRPADLPDAIEWLRNVPTSMHGTLLIGWELLDVVPCPVLEVDGEGRVREVLVADDGTERLGAPASPWDTDWCSRWWPLSPARPGSRAESGWPREAFWASLVARLADGLALAVDYGHDRGDRPPAGSLTGFRAGRAVPAVPDGSADLTAHVALDALAAALPRRDGRVTLRAPQRTALGALGVTGRRPDLALAGSEPSRYVSLLQIASESAELLDPQGLGGFGWVMHAVGRRAVDAVQATFGAGADSTPHRPA